MSKLHQFDAAFFFCGLGAGPKGLCEATARLGEDRAVFRNRGGIDFDPAACADYRYLTGAPALCADIAKLQPADLLKFFGPKPLDLVFFSSPCKGLSQLLPAASANTPEYDAMNSLFWKGIALVAETWPTSPPPLLLFENVPGIMGKRGRPWLDKTLNLLWGHYGYRCDTTVHDLAEVGGLGAHRKRFLLAARLERVLPCAVYKPPVQRVKGCGEILGTAPIPMSAAAASAGPHHVMPQISLLNCVRLSLIDGGGDWRDLPSADAPLKTRARPLSCDPRVERLIRLQASGRNASSFKGRPGLFGLAKYDVPLPTVTGSMSISGSNATAAVCDPRIMLDAPRRRGTFGVLDWNQPGKTVTGSMEPCGSNSPATVADPRIALGYAPFRDSFGVVRWDETSATVRALMTVRQARATVADPRLYELEPQVLSRLLSPMRPGDERRKYFRRDKVSRWADPTDTVTGPGGNAGAQYVADPRAFEGPLVVDVHTALAMLAAIPTKQIKKRPVLPLIIVAEDGTWHRPITDLELALLQSLPLTVNGAPLALSTDRTMTSPRERIGNAVPGDAAKAMGKQFIKSLLASKLGTWQVQSDGIWVRRDGRREWEWRGGDAGVVSQVCQ